MKFIWFHFTIQIIKSKNTIQNEKHRLCLPCDNSCLLKFFIREVSADLINYTFIYFKVCLTKIFTAFGILTLSSTFFCCRIHLIRPFTFDYMKNSLNRETYSCFSLYNTWCISLHDIITTYLDANFLIWFNDKFTLKC